MSLTAAKLCDGHRAYSRGVTSPPRIIRGKLSVPGIAERVVTRSRLTALIGGLVASRRVTLVVATAGSGKTTAVVQALAGCAQPVTWVTLDSIDAATGRFLAYLEAAVGEHAPDAKGVATSALAARLPHADAAELVVVMDGLESLCDEAGAHSLAALGTFIRYASPSVRFVLVSRVGVPLGVAGFTGLEGFVTVAENDLAFTAPEAREALHAAGSREFEVDDVMTATGGWVAGVLFEAWRSAAHVAGTGGEADPLHGYLASEILAKLTDDERELLILGSLLGEITASRATALGIADAGNLLVSLRAKHLPVTWSTGATYAMRCHPRFREYLATLLLRRGADELSRVRIAHGRLLMAEGHHQEAVEEFLAVQARADAVDAAELAIGGVIERLDLAVADRWLTTLAHQGGGESLRLAEAAMAVAVARENFDLAADVADRLLSDGTRDALARSSDTAASMMVWVYWHLGRVDDARQVLGQAHDTAPVRAVRYLMDLVEIGPQGPTASPPLTGGPMDALVRRVDYSQGRLSQVLDAPTSAWSMSVSAPWLVGGLRATGRLQEALELYEAGPGDWSAAWMQGMVVPELMIDLGRSDEARAALARGRQQIRTSGSLVFLWLSWMIEAKLELRMHRNVAAASAILDRAEQAGARRYAFLAELMDTWRGLAFLHAGEPGDARICLRRAVTSMEAADRILELPAAAVYLAEAHWRLGSAAEADEAADRALRAAAQQGSNHQLLLALTDFPAVVSRRLDAEADSDSPWHRLGRSLLDSGVPVDMTAELTLRVREFGELTMTIDGRPAKPRIAKSVELLAYLASTPSPEATREDLMTVLFEGRDDDSARSYLRQVVHRLREMLPAGSGPAFSGRTLRFTAPVALSSESVALERHISRAGRLRGAEQVGAIAAAIEIADGGEYLPGVDSVWAQERRTYLSSLTSKARLQAAHIQYEHEQFLEAERLAHQALAQDPYQESAWRLLMRIGSAVGDEDRVITAYRHCQLALAELGATPSDSTRRLLDQLRR
jgi:ATP/maltotriose-dependent transcriptional regulator MalT/DNA-binding SARP family transcriptional activator